MLTIKRKTIRPPKVDLDRLKELILRKPNGTLNRVKRVKAFLQARADGKDVKESRALAGIPAGTSVRSIVSTEIAEILLADVLKENGFGDTNIKEKLKELWDAKDPIVSKFGVIGMKPNWDAQHKALDQVLHLRGYKRKESVDNQDRPVSVVFNVLTPPGAQPVAVEVEEKK